MESFESFGFYISIASGILLTISETLPFIKNVKSNGIIQSIVQFISRKSNNKSEELTPLLQNTENKNTQEQLTKLQEQIDQLNLVISKLKQQKLVLNEIDKDKKVTIVIEAVGRV